MEEGYATPILLKSSHINTLEKLDMEELEKYSIDKFDWTYICKLNIWYIKTKIKLLIKFKKYKFI